MNQILALFRETGAMLDGHFLLSSGLHSSGYVQCALVLQYPEKAFYLGACLAGLFTSQQVQTVMAPAVGGIVVAHEVARALKRRAVFAERRQGRLQLRRGFDLAPGERILVVEDVITTGKSITEVVEIVHRRGAEVVGVGVLLDRSGGAPVRSRLSLRALLTLDIPTYQPADCPLCQQGSPVLAPGSRQMT